MPRVSIIVPVYKVEKYLCECVDSILNQTYKNLEVILIDDGSPDKCGQICDEYAVKDARVRVIHQKNQGLSAARNAGLNIFVGDYFMFVDSDDYISADMVQCLLQTAVDNDLDLASCRAYRVKNGRTIGSSGSGAIKFYNHDEAIECGFTDKDCTAWNKIYKRHVAEGARFPIGRKFEDTGAAYLFFVNVFKYAVIDKALYYYRYNDTSITQTSFDAKSRYDFVLGYVDRLEYIEKYKMPYEKENKILLLKAVLSCLTALYVDEVNAANRLIYNNCKELIYKYRSKDSYGGLNGKYKIFLWCFGKFDFVHKYGAKLSLLSKKIKKGIMLVLK